MHELFNLKGKTALITGGSQGIGRAIALVLAGYGAKVIINYLGDPEEASATLTDIRELGSDGILWEADIASFISPQEVKTWMSNRQLTADILVLNASLQINRPWHRVTDTEFGIQMNTNVRASLIMIQALSEGMCQRHWGRILTIGSVQQLRPHPQMIVYAASKNAQRSLVRSLAPEFAPHGVTINNLAPGAILTRRNKEALGDEIYRRTVEAKIPSGFIGAPEDCAAAALLLCSPAGRYITGQNLGVDGGMSLLH